MGTDDRRASRPRSQRLDIAVSDEEGRPARVPGLAPWLRRVAPPRTRGTVTVAIADDKTVRRLNRRYRRKDRPTDVLAFPFILGDGAPPPSPTYADASPQSARHGRRRSALGRHLGDIVIARGVATRQARAHGHSLSTEFRVLALHGLLHLLGYDHERDNGEMARLEARLRAQGGV